MKSNGKLWQRSAMFLLTAIVAACSGAEDGEIQGTEDIDSTQEALTMDFSGIVFNFNNARDVASISRGTNRLDLFTVRSDRIRYDRYDNGWQGSGNIFPPPGITFTKVAAVQESNRVHLAAMGSDRFIYWATSSAAGAGLSFPGFTRVTSSVAHESSSVALTSWGDNRLDLFWVTPSRKIGHRWGTGAGFTGTETGDTAANWYLQPLSLLNQGTLEATSWGNGRIDVVVGTGDGHLAHHFYDRDNGGWGRALLVGERPLQEQDDEMIINDVVIASEASGELDVYVKVTNPGNGGGESLFYTGARNRMWTRWKPATSRLGFEYLHIPGNLPSTFDDAIRWNGSRADIWGVSGGNVWQAYDQFSN